MTVAMVSAALLAIAQGCSSSGAPSAPPGSVADNSASQVIGAKGGTVTTANGNASVDIPEGALPADTTITIQPVIAAGPAGIRQIGDAYVFGPEGLVFLKPVTVAMAYRTETLGGRAPSSIVIQSAPFSTQSYQRLPTTPKDASHVGAITTHFSTHIVSLDDDVADADTDAALDDGGDSSAAEACNVKCSVTGQGDGGGPLSTCECVARCAAHKYQLTCDGAACTCSRDGAQTGTTTPAGGACDDPTKGRDAYKAGCGYPGDFPPASKCVLACQGTQDPEAGQAAPCSCSSTCDGHTYSLACTATTCTCKKDGVQTSTSSETSQCQDTTDDYVYGCNFPTDLSGGGGGGDGGGD